MNASDSTPRKKIRRTLSFLGRTVDPSTLQPQNPKGPTSARVSGPYYDAPRRTYRVVVFDGRKRKSVGAETEAAALQLKRELEGTLARCDRTIGSAFEEFMRENGKRGIKEITVRGIADKLRPFLPLHQSLSTFTAKDAQRLYETETQRVSRFGRPMRVMTHHKVLKLSKQFFRWAVERGYVAISPFEKIKPIGKAHVGKEQLRLDEARHLTQVLVSASELGEHGATAALTQLLLGLRSGEVLGRQVRDLDDHGQILWIPTGKTDNARRRLEVPEVLRPFLLRLVEGQAPERLIFRGDGAQPLNYMWLWKQVRSYCKRANLRRICPHSLRGLHSSLAVAAGCTSTAVASALGHGSFAITAKHYVEPDTLRNTAARRVAGALAGSCEAEDSRLLERLLALSPEQRATLLRALGAKTAN